jgi:CheY-like chemotaxis protein
VKRPGRILVVDDQEEWTEILKHALSAAGFKVDTAHSTKDAVARLEAAPYHLLVLDIRMEDSDETNVQGMDLLRDLHNSQMGAATYVVMHSAYSTPDQMREAFASHHVADFLRKEQFRDGLDFLDTVRRVFAERVQSNLDLDITWEQVGGAEEAVLNVIVGGERVKRDTPLHALAATELDDLLCRLFHTATSIQVKPLTQGHGGSGVLLVRPFYTDGAGRQVVVKFGDVLKIDNEGKNYKKYVQPFVGSGRSTAVFDLRRTARLGGIVYSFVGTDVRNFESFESFYHRADAWQIRGALTRLFDDTCGPWYANAGTLRDHDLTADYQTLLGFTPEKLERAVQEKLKSVQGKDRIRIEPLGDRTFTNPILAMSDRHLHEATYVCTTHGDFNEGNILLDEAGNSWLIDFEKTGPGHILRDVAKLDSVVRFQLLGPEDATLDERLVMEEALCKAKRLGEEADLVANVGTENPALLKAYTVVAHLREIARALIARKGSDTREYHIAALYFALGTLRYYSLPTIQRQHAILSASLLADRLGL